MRPTKRRWRSSPWACSRTTPSRRNGLVRDDSSQGILRLQSVLRALAGQEAGVEAEAVDADRRRLQEIVRLDPGGDLVRLGPAQIGERDVRPVLAPLGPEPRAAGRALAALGQPLQRLAVG